MEYRQLKHFIALYEEQGFRRAAAKEQIVQSGLSHSIQALERASGAELYVRASRPVRLTDAGLALLGPARRAVSAMEEAQTALVEHHALVRGTLNVGVLQSSEYLVPTARAVASFTREYPGVDVRLRWDNPPSILAAVENGSLHCGLAAALPGRRPNLQRTSIAREPLVLVLPATHALTRRKELHLRDLGGEIFIDVQGDWTPRPFTDVAFERLGLERRVRCEVNDWHLLIELVASGAGIGFAPVGVLERSTLTSIVTRPVVDHRLEREFHLVMPRGEAASRAAVEFGRHVLQAAVPVAPKEKGQPSRAQA